MHLGQAPAKIAYLIFEGSASLCL